MKKYLIAFLKRGLMCSVGGPVILAIVYGCLGITEAVTSLSPQEVCLGILSASVMAFIASGITMIYQIEQLPLATKILVHGGVLYLDYLVMYVLNSWIPRDLSGIGIFTAIFVAGYGVVWLVVYLTIKYKTDQINKKLCT